MSNGVVQLDEVKILELYAKFRNALSDLGDIYPGVPYYYFVDQGCYDGISMVAALIAREHLNLFSNAINKFAYNLHRMTAWDNIFKVATEEEKFLALFEFVASLISECLAFPYALKQIFARSVCEISHHTNRFLSQDWKASRLKPEKSLNFDDMKKFAGNYKAWPDLYDALAQLNREDFKAATEDFRTRLNHGFARRIEFGHSFEIELTRYGKEDSTFEYLIKDALPLRASDLLPALAIQYRAACKCYERYLTLIKEQEALWPKPKPR